MADGPHLKKMFRREFSSTNITEADGPAFKRRAVRHLYNGHIRSAFFDNIAVGSLWRTVRACKAGQSAETECFELFACNG